MSATPAPLDAGEREAAVERDYGSLTTAELLTHWQECDCHDSWDQCPCAEGGHSEGCDCCIYGAGLCGPKEVTR